MIPKIKGIDYFNATQKGAKEAAQALGIELVFDGPMESSVDRQIELIDSFITRKFDVIAVSPNDPDAIAPVLKRARDQGVHVVTWDADANPKTSGREFFIDQASPESVGRTLVDVMAKEAGEDAKTVIVTGTLTAANQNEWMKWMELQIKEKYPKMRILAKKASEEDQQLARQVTQDVLTAYDDLDGIFAITSVAFPGAATALEKSPRKGKVALTGLSSPKTMRKWVENGTVKTVVLWNPVDLGYLTIYASKALCDGTLKPGATSLEAGRLGGKDVVEDRVVLGDPMLFTKDNIARFGF
ncbi:MAG: autoinducer 2 ABC transporter substrate-binding protein [Armatimonadetes bacterium]|nr:autoinducer 2 ABC transporter substrate-binding protein [Armatimonadota bacterium]